MILVTGGTGMVGAHLLLELTRKYDRVRAIYRSISHTGHVLDIFSHYLENPEKQYSRIEWIPGDITDIDSLFEALSGISHVYHAAADVSFEAGSYDGLRHNNVEGTANVVNACLEKDIKKLCFVSSTASLGSAPPREEITEDILWVRSKKNSPYSVSKFGSEMEVWRGIAEGLNAVIVNPSFIIGPGNWKRSSSYLFSAVWKGIRFYTNGISGFVDIRDVVKAMVRLMEGDYHGERFIVSSENLSYRQILEKIALALDKNPPRIYASPFLVSLARRTDWLANALFGKPRSITRDTGRSSRKTALFSNRKIRETIKMDFIPIDQSVKDTARIFLKVHTATG